jgi:SMC interacting uncharacterized protein involved in chromosome segregation
MDTSNVNFGAVIQRLANKNTQLTVDNAVLEEVVSNLEQKVAELTTELEKLRGDIPVAKVSVEAGPKG